MTEEAQESAEKYTSEVFEAVLGKLSNDQLRFVVARQEFATDKEAAEAVDIKPNTVYHWPDVVKEAVRLMSLDGLISALHIRRRNLAKAMMVKVGGLDSEDERVRQSASTEIIEWETGKATQRQELTGADGDPILIKLDR